MSEAVVEIILWVLLAFFLGCIIGYLLHGALVGARREGQNGQAAELEAGVSEEAEASEEKSETAKVAHLAVPVLAAPPPTAKEGAVAEPVRTSAVTSKSEPTRPAATNPPSATAGKNSNRPKGIPAPRAGSPDELQRISGVGPKIEISLHQMGIFHFDQIAAWTTEQEQWVDDQLKFRGRIGRDEWVKQAKLLAHGKEEEFVALYGSGAAAVKKVSKSKTNSRNRTVER
jgi:NADH-quinone oxidoreductase subunit E